MRHYDQSKMEELLQEVDFPAEKQKIIDQAKESGAENAEMKALGKIEEKEYQNQEEVFSALVEGKMGHPSPHQPRTKADAMA